MTRDDRLYAFIVAHTSRSRSRIRRICIHRRWLKAAAILASLVVCAALYGLLGLYREATHLRVRQENDRLKVENEKQRQQLEKLEDRVDAIEDKSRRLAEMSGVAGEGGGESGGAGAGDAPRGSGGPFVEMDEAGVAAVEARAAQLEAELRAYERAMSERVPSIWPVAGEVTDGFGGRRNPFGGSSFELHPGQDISAPRGAEVVAAAGGTVVFAATQSGYGQLVTIDHGGGLTTRYAHLSKIEVAAGQQVSRGQLIGRVGSTGRSTGPHLHYEVRIGEEAVNPRAYLPARDGEAARGESAPKN
jgi:murein DD-endopeptidase MepM/ murein hydrolase activator NlpD